MAKSSAQRTREYRERLREKKLLSTKKKEPKTAAERAREYRARKKALNVNAVNFPNLSTLGQLQNSVGLNNCEVTSTGNNRIHQNSSAGQNNTLQTKKESMYTGVDVGPITLRRMSSYYRIIQPDMSVNKESAVDRDKVDAIQRRGVKQEFIEIELTAVDEQKCIGSTSTPASIKVEPEDVDLNTEHTASQETDTYDQYECFIKKENTVSGDSDLFKLCSGMEKENVENNGGDIEKQRSTRATSTPANAGNVPATINGMQLGICIKVKGANLVIGPPVLLNTNSHYRINESNKIEKVSGGNGNNTTPEGESDEDDSDDAENSTYTCDYCQKVFTNKSSITRHIICVHASGSYKCNECEKSYICEKYLKVHKANVHTELNKKCNICSKLMRPRSLKGHMLNMHSDTKYQCNICEEIMTSKANLYNHMNDFHQNQPVETVNRCHYCQKIYSTKQTLKAHIKKFHVKSKHTCSECIVGFESEDRLQNHLKLVHWKRERGESNQQSVCNQLEKENMESTHHTIHESNTMDNTSSQQREVIDVKKEPVYETLDVGPVVFQHMDINYRPVKEEPLID